MNMAVEFEENTKSIKDYLKIVRRRYKLLVYPAVAVFIVILLGAALWPPTYQAEATILIEEQEIPKDLVRSTVTSFADQQIQVITQRVMTLKNIMDLVERYDLYSEDELSRMSSTEVLTEIRDEKVGLNVVSAEVRDPKTGRPTVATIAFNLSFKHRSPTAAQKVTSDLVTLYLNENLRIRTEKSNNTSSFLKAESESLSEQLVDLETRLAEFKSANEGSLPEYYAYNLSVIDRTERELLDTSLRLKELEKRRFQFEGELMQATKYAPTILPTGESVLSDYDRLKSVESEFRRKSAIYSESHPDLIRLARELEELQQQVGSSMSGEDLRKALDDEENKLSALRDKYQLGHPEIVAQERVVAELKSSFSSGAVAPLSTNEPAPDNPSYIFIESQLKGTITEIKILEEKTAELRAKLEKFENLVLRSPIVEKEYTALQRDYQNTQVKYTDVKGRLMEAELSKNLEEGRQGERFTLIQPPIMPEQPISPNRPAIIVLGVFLAGLVGIAVVVVAELMDPSIRGEKQLAEVLGVQPLVSVPYIKLDHEKQASRKRLIYLLAGIFVLGILSLLALHFFIKPLDVVWFILMRKLGI